MVFSRPPSPVAELESRTFLDLETREVIFSALLENTDDANRAADEALATSLEKALDTLDLAAQLCDDAGLVMLAECVKSVDLLLSVEEHIDFTKSAARAYHKVRNVAKDGVPPQVEVALKAAIKDTCDVVALSICADIGYPWDRAAFDKAAPLAFDGTLLPDQLLELQHAFNFHMGLGLPPRGG